MAEYERTKIPVDVDVNVTEHRRVVYEGDQRPPVRERGYYDDRPSAPYTGPSPILMVGIVVVIGIVAFVITAWFLAGTRAQADDQPICHNSDPSCWTAWKEVEIERQKTARAMANSNANASAGFGNDDGETHRSAVLPWPKSSVNETVRQYRPELNVHRDIQTYGV